jgi:hypothetical protein
VSFLSPYFICSAVARSSCSWLGLIFFHFSQFKFLHIFFLTLSLCFSHLLSRELYTSAAFLVSAALSKKLYPSQSWYFASSIVSSGLFFLARVINLLSGSSLRQSKWPQSGASRCSVSVQSLMHSLTKLVFWILGKGVLKLALFFQSIFMSALWNARLKTPRSYSCIP